jgi:beta-glucosidase
LTQHPWRGLRAQDGYVFERTTDHEKRRDEDAEWIAQLGAGIYRCGVDWCRLQVAPMAPFQAEVVKEYADFFENLKGKGIQLMLVLHHFAHPDWFEERGGWTKEENIPFFLDYARQCIKHFGKYAAYWNTFNEPNVYAMNAFMLGNFPPHRRGRYTQANRVLDNMGRAHDIAFGMLREKSDAPIGISLNTGCFEGKNFLGRGVAAFVRWWFMTRAARPFERCDFWGLSYYAYMPFDPFPVDAQSEKGRQKLAHWQIPTDKMWGYKPEGLGEVLRFFSKKYQKPIVITENGICSDSSPARIQALRDYLGVCYRAMGDGVDLLGYIHWSTWDNFEWHLGPTYRFGLIRVNFETMQREMTEAGRFYHQIVKNNGL